MAARRLIIVMISLLVISSIAAALVPVAENGLEDDTTTTTTTPPPPPAGELVRETVEAGGKVERIRVRVGDRLALRVRVKRPSEIAIPELGELVAVDPAAPASFDLLPDEPSTYRVLLLDADRTIARIQVVKRAQR